MWLQQPADSRRSSLRAHAKLTPTGRLLLVQSIAAGRPIVHAAREMGVAPSMGRVASALDNAMMESFFGTMQLELLDRQRWATRAELGRAIFEWIEGWYNPRRRHTSLGGLSPADYERMTLPTTEAA